MAFCNEPSEAGKTEKGPYRPPSGLKQARKIYNPSKLPSGTRNLGGIEHGGLAMSGPPVVTLESGDIICDPHTDSLVARKEQTYVR